MGQVPIPLYKKLEYEVYEKVLKNVPQQNKKYVEKQLNELEKNFMSYLSYWNEKYYRNGFVDGVQIIIKSEL